MIEQNIVLDVCHTIGDSGALSYDATLSDFRITEGCKQYGRAGVLDPTTDSLYTANSWLDKAIDDLIQLADLQENWDSYGSPRISNEFIDSAKNFLNDLEFEDISPPFIVPISGGSIQFEWDKGERGLEIEFIDIGNLAYLKVVNNEPVEEGEFQIANKHLARSLIHWLNSA